MPTRQEELEKLAFVALAPLVEVAWADGACTDAERRGVYEAARSMGFDQKAEFCRTTLRRWLHEPPPTEALQQWREMLRETLVESDARAAEKSEDRLMYEARRIAKMDQRPFEPSASVDAQAGITPEEQRVLDELAAALTQLEDPDEAAS